MGRHPFQLSPDIIESQQLLLNLLNIQPLGVVGIVVNCLGQLLLPLDKIFVVVKIAIISRNPVITGQIIGVGHLLAGHQRLIKLFPMAGADHLDFVLGIEEFKQRLGQIGNGRGRSFLHKDVALIAVRVGVEDQVHRIVQGHEKAGHVRVGDGEGFALFDQFDKQGDDRTTRGHDIAVAGTVEGRLLGVGKARFGDDDLLHHRLGDSHGVDRIHRLVGAEGDNSFDAFGYGSVENIFGAENIGLDRFQRIKFTRRDLLQGRSLKDIIDSVHGRQQTVVGAHVADVELDFGIGETDAHIFLLQFVTGKNADLFDLSAKETAQDGVAEGASAASDE